MRDCISVTEGVEVDAVVVVRYGVVSYCVVATEGVEGDAGIAVRECGIVDYYVTGGR